MVALSAELVEVAQRALEIANDYAKEREQFGRPDRFLPSGLAPARRHAVGGRGGARLPTTRRGAPRLSESLPLAASMAKARASDAACEVTHDAIQTLGGIGFTWEHDIHFFLKRARVSAQLMGTLASTADGGAGGARFGPGARRGLNRLSAPSPRRTARSRRRGSAPSRPRMPRTRESSAGFQVSIDALIRMLIWLGSSGLRLKRCAPQFPQKHFSNAQGAARPSQLLAGEQAERAAVDPGLCRSHSSGPLLATGPSGSTRHVRRCGDLEANVSHKQLP